MKLDLHVHYDHSRSLTENIDFISAMELDGIALCAFRDIEYVKEIKERVKNKLVIVSQELICHPFHVVGIGLERTIDGGLDVRETIKRVRAQGGFAVIAHPLMGKNIYRRAVNLFKYDFDAIEGYSSLIAPLVIPNLLAGLVGKMRKLPSLATSDAHRLRYIGASYIEVPEESDDLNRIFKHIRNGEFSCTRRGYNDFEHYLYAMRGPKCVSCNKKLNFSNVITEKQCQTCRKAERNSLVCTNGHYICERCFMGIV